MYLKERFLLYFVFFRLLTILENKNQTFYCSLISTTSMTRKIVLPTVLGKLPKHSILSMETLFYINF